MEKLTNNNNNKSQKAKIRLSEQMKNIFKQLLFHNVGEVQTKHLIKNSNYENELNSYHDILITELKKPINSKKPEDIRKLDVIIFALEKYKYFIRFRLFNKLNRSILRRCAKFFRYKKFKKGEYIFYMSQISDCFYGILTGSVSIRGISTETYKIDLQDFENEQIDSDIEFTSDIIENYKKKKISSPNEIRMNLEYEKTKILPGMCFGEWGIINNTVRAGSAYCLEDTEVFYMTQEHFIQNLSQIFLNSLNHKKYFLNSIIPKLGLRLSLSVSKFYDYGDIIYTNKDEAKYLYIIYQGEVSFLYKFDENNLNKTTKLKNFKILNSMRKGCVFGKESFNKKIKYYQNNIICTQDFTVIYEIKTEVLKKEGLDLSLVEDILEKQYNIIDKSYQFKKLFRIK